MEPKILQMVTTLEADEQLLMKVDSLFKVQPPPPPPHTHLCSEFALKGTWPVLQTSGAAKCSTMTAVY